MSTASALRGRRGPLLLVAFLCCTLRFNADHEANDAGYTYPGETRPTRR